MKFLQSLPPEISFTARIEHCQELIHMFEGYIAAHSVHREYYGSIITHLNAIIDGYNEQLNKIKAIEECKNNQVH